MYMNLKIFNLILTKWQALTSVKLYFRFELSLFRIKISLDKTLGIDTITYIPYFLFCRHMTLTTLLYFNLFCFQNH